MNALAQIDAPASLPALVRKAAKQLAEAETSAEVLEARDYAKMAYDAAKSAGRAAKAKQAYDDVIVAVYRAQANALDIEALAKRRLADEYDAAQERGELRAANTGRSTSALEAPTVSDIGLTHKDIHEARQIRDAELSDPGIVRRTVDGLVDAGQEPTRAAVKRAIEKRPIIDLKGRNPDDFHKAMHFKGLLREYSRDLSKWSLPDVLPRLLPDERETIRAIIEQIDSVHADIMKGI